MKLARLRDIEAALDRPDGSVRLYLLHGPDASAAGMLAARLGAAMGPDAERVDLDGATLKSDPARLADEVASISLFGAARHIRVTNAGEESLDALTALLGMERAGSPVVVLAPAVRSTARIVKLAIGSPHALAFACYEPDGAELERSAVALARAAGLRPVGDVPRRLVAAAGGDRQIIAREVEKLALYRDAAPDRPQDLDDAALDALAADLGESEISRLADALIAGDSAAAGGELARLEEAGTSPIPWLRLLARRIVALAAMRAEMDAGETVEVVMKRHRIFFREERATARALRRWPAPLLSRALASVRQAERRAMGGSGAGPVLAAQAALDLARALERRG